jgi:hypothetical protein
MQVQPTLYCFTILASGFIEIAFRRLDAHPVISSFSQRAASLPISTNRTSFKRAVMEPGLQPNSN